MERRKNRIVLSGIEQLRELRNVPENIAMTEDDALGLARAAACKKQCRLRVAAFFGNPQKTQKQRRRNEDRQDPPKERFAISFAA